MNDSQEHAGAVDESEFEGYDEPTGSDNRQGRTSSRGTSQPPPDSNNPPPDEPGNNGGAPPADEESHVSRGCVIIGPSEAGKTTLLAAMHRACQMPVKDGLDLEFAATSTETADLIKVGLSNILGIQKGYDATTDVKTYPFQIGVTETNRKSWEMPSFTDLEIEMSDGGGGFIFSPNDSNKKFRNDMTRLIRDASVLVLCVDVNAPNMDVLNKEIEGLLTETRVRYRERIRNGWLARLFYRIKTFEKAPEYTIRERRVLNVDHVLILLTQVDRYTKGFKNPLDLARQLETVSLARATLDASVLQSILKSLKRNAQLAVGVCSSYGFLPDGSPFADHTGKPESLNERGGEMLRYWMPFGVRDAIYFLATGKTRGTVRTITERDMLDDRKPIRVK